MSRVLRIAEVCRELGRSRDCIRDWVKRGMLPATRAPSGQLQFDPAKIEAIKRGEMAPPEQAHLQAPKRRIQEPPNNRIPAPRRRRLEEDLAPWDQEVHQARAAVEVERLSKELEIVRAEHDRVKELARTTREEEGRILAEQERLTALKRYARLHSRIPDEIVAELTAEIERFVTSEQVPAWLPNRQQTEIVLNYVRQRIRNWTKEQADRLVANFEESLAQAKRKREEDRFNQETSRRKEAERRNRAATERAHRIDEERRAADRARRRAERQAGVPGQPRKA